MITRRRVLALLVMLVALGGYVVWWQYATVLDAERARVGHGSEIISSPFGPIEYAVVGQGTPVLVSHGAGGGFDQIIDGVDGLTGAGYQIIAPSRFGYLRSANPPDPSPAKQADAYAALLDALHLEKVAVVGLSAGSMSALEFAARYPERCRSLILLVPAVSLAGSALPPQGALGARGAVSRALIELTLRSDFLYWLSITLMPGQMIHAALATDPKLVAAASPDERRRILEVLRHVLPLSERYHGLLDDARFTSEPLPVALETIKVPTLAISLEDDYYRTIGPARAIAAKIPGARLITYRSGGHLWAGHNADMLAAIAAFLKQH